MARAFLWPSGGKKGGACAPHMSTVTHSWPPAGAGKPDLQHTCERPWGAGYGSWMKPMVPVGATLGTHLSRRALCGAHLDARPWRGRAQTLWSDVRPQTNTPRLPLVNRTRLPEDAHMCIHRGHQTRRFEQKWTRRRWFSHSVTCNNQWLGHCAMWRSTRSCRAPHHTMVCSSHMQSGG